MIVTLIIEYTLSFYLTNQNSRDIDPSQPIDGHKNELRAISSMR